RSWFIARQISGRLCPRVGDTSSTSRAPEPAAVLKRRPMLSAARPMTSLGLPSGRGDWISDVADRVRREGQHQRLIIGHGELASIIRAIATMTNAVETNRILSSPRTSSSGGSLELVVAGGAAAP